MSIYSGKIPAVSGVHILLVLLKAFRSVTTFGAATIRDSELNDSDFRVLEVLLHKGPLPVNTIGPKVFLTPGSISVAVDRLHEKGLVSRIDSETDRRVRMVDLTAEGRKLIRRVFNAHAKDMERVAQVLTNAERVQLVEGLKKLGKNAEALQGLGNDAAFYSE
jgi:MarR family 2-MHQ and catechol resistance regulon transcriptional repressor